MRETCVFAGCTNLRTKKGINKGGSPHYSRYCNKHRRFRSGETKIDNKYIANDKCELCGWEEAPCDRHRIDPKRGYYRENVKVLCPNCHRLVSLGKIVLCGKDALSWRGQWLIG